MQFTHRHKSSKSRNRVIGSKECYISFGATAAVPLISLLHQLSPEALAGKVTPSIVGAAFNSPGLMVSLAGFALSLILVHGVFAALLVALWVPLANHTRLAGNRRVWASLLFFVLMQAAVLAINSLLFKTSATIPIAAPHIFASTGGLILITLVGWHAWHLQQRFARVFAVAQWKHAAVPVASLFGLIFAINSDSSAVASPVRTKPDIVLIGIDSMRADHLSSPGVVDAVTPNIDRFLASSWKPNRTYTPLARTFPSWVSILTGRYPLHHGARFNLINPERVHDLEHSLPFLLRKEGYMTAYAIDESRFSNIDSSYGFDRTLTPKIGAADFISTTMSDLPLINLLSRTFVYSWIFPYQYRNRATHVVYDPATFDQDLSLMLGATDPAKPLFLAVHFELAHWPYKWRNVNSDMDPGAEIHGSKSPGSYRNALRRVDEQFQALIDALENDGRLRNAIVVLLSDHGEGFYNFSESWGAAEPKHHLTLPPFGWHGLNVLDEAQTQTVFGVKTFGWETPSNSPVQITASLIDIAPSVLALAGLDQSQLNSDGCVLLTKLPARTDAACHESRAVLTESGFYVPAMMKPGEADEKAIAQEAQAFYDVTPSGRLTIKDDLIEELMRRKQRAAIVDEWLVASLPTEGSQFVFANLDKRIYWNAELKEETPKNPKLTRALKAFCRLYGDDDVDVERFCRSNGFPTKQKKSSTEGKIHRSKSWRSAMEH